MQPRQGPLVEIDRLVMASEARAFVGERPEVGDAWHGLDRIGERTVLTHGIEPAGDGLRQLGGSAAAQEAGKHLDRQISEDTQPRREEDDQEPVVGAPGTSGMNHTGDLGQEDEAVIGEHEGGRAVGTQSAGCGHGGVPEQGPSRSGLSAGIN